MSNSKATSVICHTSSSFPINRPLAKSSKWCLIDMASLSKPQCSFDMFKWNIQYSLAARAEYLKTSLCAVTWTTRAKTKICIATLIHIVSVLYPNFHKLHYKRLILCLSAFTETSALRFCPPEYIMWEWFMTCWAKALDSSNCAVSWINENIKISRRIARCYSCKIKVSKRHLPVITARESSM